MKKSIEQFKSYNKVPLIYKIKKIQSSSPVTIDVELTKFSPSAVQFMPAGRVFKRKSFKICIKHLINCREYRCTNTAAAPQLQDRRSTRSQQR